MTPKNLNSKGCVLDVEQIQIQKAQEIVEEIINPEEEKVDDDEYGDD